MEVVMEWNFVMAAAHLAKLWVLDNSTIAAKLLLKVLEYLIVAEFLLQSLDGGQTLPTVTLLYANVHILF